MENSEGSRADSGQKISFVSTLSQVFFHTDGHFRPHYQTMGRGGDGSNRLVLLRLGLLNVVLLIVAVILGINCAKVKQNSLHVSHSAAKHLIDELYFLRSNHSDVIEAEEVAKYALKRALKNHAQLKERIKRQQTVNDDYQKQVEELQTEMLNLQANISALEENCGRCLPKWILHNSSCYYFSHAESSAVKKNWPDSRADCVTRGADLIVIDNEEEQRFVSHRAESMERSRYFWLDGFWIGLTDTDTEGTWIWINNVTEVEQRYWADGEPNNFGHHGEDCGVAVYSPTNPWKTRFDGNCLREEKHWICEMT